jgi:hypothetical protein
MNGSDWLAVLIGIASAATEFLWEQRAGVVVVIGLFFLFSIANSASAAVQVLWKIHELTKSDIAERKARDKREDWKF